MPKKDKHIRISESVADLIELFAKKTMRSKSMAYEIALKSFFRYEKKALIESGIPESKIEEALLAD